jgi:hypothetical protein
MTAVNTLKLLDSLEEQVENQLQLAIKEFQNLSEEMLLKPSASGGWSVAQCLWHLNSYGDFYLPEIAKAINKKGSPGVLFKSGMFGAYFIRMMQPGVKRYKAFKDHIPPDVLNAYAVVAEFIHQLELLLTYIKQARSANPDARLPISISPWIKLKLGDVLQFVIAHNERHIQQASRNLN